MKDLQNQAPAQQKSLFIRDLKPKDSVRTTLMVKHKEVMAAKNGKPYLAMVLGDRSGDIDTRVWEQAEALAAMFQEGDVLAISGKVNSFQNRLQLVVDHLIPVESSEVALADYLPAGPENTEDLFQELVGVFQSLQNEWVKKLALSLLEDPEIARRYKLCPAAKTIHHAFIGGLLSHSRQLTRLVDAILPLYEDIDRSLMMFGAVFHDFGKIYELSYDRTFGYTDEGKLVGHITIAACLIDRKIRQIPGFPVDLEYQVKHLVLSHHGRLDYGSPKRPATIEAQLLHHLDDMDSKVNSIQTMMRNERNSSRWTAYHKAYDQYYYKPDVLTRDEH